MSYSVLNTDKNQFLVRDSISQIQETPEKAEKKLVTDNPYADGIESVNDADHLSIVEVNEVEE